MPIILKLINLPSSSSSSRHKRITNPDLIHGSNFDVMRDIQRTLDNHWLPMREYNKKGGKKAYTAELNPLPCRLTIHHIDAINEEAAITNLTNCLVNIIPTNFSLEISCVANPVLHFPCQSHSNFQFSIEGFPQHPAYIAHINKQKIMEKILSSSSESELKETELLLKKTEQALQAANYTAELEDIIKFNECKLKLANAQLLQAKNAMVTTPHLENMPNDLLITTFEFLSSRTLINKLLPTSKTMNENLKTSLLVSNHEVVDQFMAPPMLFFPETQSQMFYRNYSKFVKSMSKDVKDMILENQISVADAKKKFK